MAVANETLQKVLCHDYYAIAFITFKHVCQPLPVFVVESSEVFKLGNFFEVLSKFIQLLVFLPVEVSLHEGSNLTGKHTKQVSETRA